MALVQTLMDSFWKTSLTTSKWDAYTNGHSHTWNSDGGQVNYNASTTAGMYAILESDNTYDMTASYVQIRTLTMPSSATAVNAAFGVVNTDATNQLLMFVEAGTLYASKIVAGVQTNIASVAYNSTTTKWWRIINSGGNILWQYGSDGLNWTTLATQATPFTITSLHAFIQGTSYTTNSNPGTFKWDYFNGVPQTVSPTGLATAEAFGTLSITRNFTIYPEGIASAEAFGTLSFEYDQVVTPTGIASAEAFGTPAAVVPPLTSTGYSTPDKPTTAYSEEVV